MWDSSMKKIYIFVIPLRQSRSFSDWIISEDFNTNLYCMTGADHAFNGLRMCMVSNDMSTNPVLKCHLIILVKQTHSKRSRYRPLFCWHRSAIKYLKSLIASRLPFQSSLMILNYEAMEYMFWKQRCPSWGPLCVWKRHSWVMNAILDAIH